jgi:alkylation response protein AidB-like acyl-CoA dehydrogenase
MPRDAPMSDDPTSDADRRQAAIAQLLRSVTGLVPAMRRNATGLDRRGAFPADDIGALREHGVLLAPLPIRHGGLGLGTEPEGAVGLFDLLRLIGFGNLSVGRIVEGHVNALALICIYGTETQMARAAEDAGSGHLFAIWNTETPPGVRLAERGLLSGRKDHGSAAGSATRPLITVDHPNNSRLLVARLEHGERAGDSEHVMQGMRATQSGWADFEGYEPSAADWIGTEGDYLREPAFSAGAWRAHAVILGGIEALVGEFRVQLCARGRQGNPHQAARVAQALIAQETAFLWTRKAACIAEAGTAAAEAITGYVNLARRAVERAGFEVIELVERSLGLSALVDGNPVERLVRDLSTMMRQPALDDALAQAAAHFVAAPLPDVVWDIPSLPRGAESAA